MKTPPPSRRGWTSLRPTSNLRRRACALLLLLLSGNALDAFVSDDPAVRPLADPAQFREDRILVKPNPGVDLDGLHLLLGMVVLEEYPEMGNLQVIQLLPLTTVPQAIDSYQQSGLVEYAEPDFFVQALVHPNDPSYLDGTQWALNNLGQSGGVPDGDIDAPEGWDLQTSAAQIVVAVIDSGVRYTHQDLAANMWINPGESGLDFLGFDKRTNLIDDDGNGYIDDVHGINAILGTGDPRDDHGHGTHVAGTVGAVGNNGLGVAGVAWRVQLMACKSLDQATQGSLSDAIECIDYARAKGAQLINASWGGYDFTSQALRDAIASARNAGIIFVAATGNAAGNNDARPLYPASYDLDNIIAVAATDRTDQLASFSNFGSASVDLGAPGDFIYSTFNSSDAGYEFFRGTSMAAPHVAGVGAMTWARNSSASYSQIITRVLSSTDPLSSLAGKCVTGGRLNLQKALAGSGGTAPPAPAVTVAATDASASEGGADNGTFSLSRSGDTSASLLVRFTLAGSASNGSDYQALPESITIPAGASSVDLNVVPIDDASIEGQETVVLTLSPDAAYVVGSPGQAVVTINDDDSAPALPRVSVAVSDSVAAERDRDPGEFTIQRSGNTSGSLTVRYSLSGTAVNGADYDSLPSSVTIPSGATSVGVVVRPIDDALVEGDETVVLTLNSDSAYAVGSPQTATIVIQDDDSASTRPSVTVTATDPDAAESGPNAGEFQISRSGSTERALNVKYTLGGTAQEGDDYKPLASSVKIAAGASAAKVRVTPKNDSLAEGTETVVLTLKANSAYDVGSPSSATVSIADDDAPAASSGPPIVTVSATDAQAAEAGPDPGSFTFTRSGSTASALTIHYTLGGTATKWDDYRRPEGDMPESISIPPGAGSFTITISPVDDLEIENTETVVLQLSADPQYELGESHTATISIADNDSVVLP